MEPILFTLILVVICLALNVYAIRFNTVTVDKVKPEELVCPGEQKQPLCFSIEYPYDGSTTIQTDLFIVEPGDEITIEIKIIVM